MVAPARSKALLAAVLILTALYFPQPEVSHADIVPPEKLHPVAESYRRSAFVLNLNPVVWKEVWSDMDRITRHLSGVDVAEDLSRRVASQALVLVEPEQPVGGELAAADLAAQGIDAVRRPAREGHRVEDLERVSTR